MHRRYPQQQPDRDQQQADQVTEQAADADIDDQLDGSVRSPKPPAAPVCRGSSIRVLASWPIVTLEKDAERTSAT
jgi:hypothetical protein